jgi:phosphoribosylformylglycinamidine cyclo-ligase
MSGPRKGYTYSEAGVDQAREDGALGPMLEWINRTLAFRTGVGRPLMGVGHFATVLELGGNLGLALCIDSVGSKLLVAEITGKYDTIGIDCVAMNVNDLICIGADPIAMVDYIAVETIDPAVLEAVAKGLHRGAELAGISIPGGEIAQLPEIVRGVAPGKGLDLAGAAVGLVPTDRLITGAGIADRDLIVGLPSSGVHSNGLTLARRVLFDHAQLSPRDTPASLSRPVGEELLEPTAVYVKPIREMLAHNLPITGMVNITGGGLLNLPRLDTDASFVVENLPEPRPIFSLIQELGQVSDAEMYRVFNMGVGFCLTVKPQAGAMEWIETIAQEHGMRPMLLGFVRGDGKKQVLVKPKNLVGAQGAFHQAG